MLVHGEQGEGDAEVGDAVLLRHRHRGGVEVAAGAPQVGRHPVPGVVGLQALHRLGGVQLVVQHEQLQPALVPSGDHPAIPVDVLDGQVVGVLDVLPEGSVAAGEGDDRADTDGLPGLRLPGVLLLGRPPAACRRRRGARPPRWRRAAPAGCAPAGSTTLPARCLTMSLPFSSRVDRGPGVHRARRAAVGPVRAPGPGGYGAGRRWSGGGKSAWRWTRRHFPSTRR